MMLQRMASGYDASMLRFSDEMGNILTSASNSVKTINAWPQEHAMSCSASVSIGEKKLPFIESRSDLNSAGLKTEKSCYANIK